MADITDDEIKALYGRTTLPGTRRMGEMEFAMRAGAAAGTSDDGMTCCDMYCTAERPPEGAELTSGWYVVGSDDSRMVFCPMHGYGHMLRARRQAAFERWKAQQERRLCRPAALGRVVASVTPASPPPVTGKTALRPSAGTTRGTRKGRFTTG
jgi:hypothetical protein